MAENNETATVLGMLPIPCCRQNKIVHVHMPVDEMKGYIEAMEARARNGAALLKNLEQIPDGQTPDLIVVFKGQAFVLPTIPDNAKQDVAIRRALNTALGADATDNKFFDVPAPTSREKKSDEKTEVAS